MVAAKNVYTVTTDQVQRGLGRECRELIAPDPERSNAVTSGVVGAHAAWVIDFRDANLFRLFENKLVVVVKII